MPPRPRRGGVAGERATKDDAFDTTCHTRAIQWYAWRSSWISQLPPLYRETEIDVGEWESGSYAHATRSFLSTEKKLHCTYAVRAYLVCAWLCAAWACVGSRSLSLTHTLQPMESHLARS